MNYRKLVNSAKENGNFSDKTMWKSVESISLLVDELFQQDEHLYWKFMRKQHGIIYNCHYSEDFALHDVDHLSYTAKDGKKHTGGHWSVDDIEQATRSMTFPSEVNIWDKYVAFNAAYADFCLHFDDKQILQIAYDFYFADEDFVGNNKIWRYMCMTYGF
jgi:hypothetical protein